VVEGHERRVGGFHARIVVSGYVQERNVEAADEVLEVVERQVAAREDEVRPQCLELVPV
jgi:hypothetical protein